MHDNHVNTPDNVEEGHEWNLQQTRAGKARELTPKEYTK